MALPNDERLMHLRQLAQRLAASPASPERDELLARARLRMAEIEAWEELGPPSSMPALSDERIWNPDRISFSKAQASERRSGRRRRHANRGSDHGRREHE